MRLRLYIILQIFTFNKIKKEKEEEKKAITTTELRKMSKEVYTILTESTVNTAITRLYATPANHKKIIYTMTHSLPN